MRKGLYFKPRSSVIQVVLLLNSAIALSCPLTIAFHRDDICTHLTVEDEAPTRTKTKTDSTKSLLDLLHAGLAPTHADVVRVQKGIDSIPLRVPRFWSKLLAEDSDLLV